MSALNDYGTARIVLELTRKDGAVDRITVHNMKLLDGDFSIDSIGSSSTWKPSDAPKTPRDRKFGDIHLRGELLPLSDDDQILYTVESPASTNT